MTQGEYMARRRFKRIRAAGRFVSTRARRSYAKHYSTRRSGYAKSGSNPLMNIVLPAFAYGAVRAPIKNAVMPMIPSVLGENTDEVVMGVGGYLLMKNTTGFLHDFGKAALYVESASLGNNLVSPMIVSMLPSSTTSGVNIYN